MKEDVVGAACSMHMENKKCRQNVGQNSSTEESRWETVLHEEMLLKWLLLKYGIKMETGEKEAQKR
jgi:hypothetical protein